jgi:hypothetical protein
MSLYRGLVTLSLLAVIASNLVGCESTPSIGQVVNAHVLAVPQSRADLKGGFTDLHAALSAGVGRAEADEGRLWRAQCVEPGASAADGLQPRIATLLLPEGTALRAGAVVDIEAHPRVEAADSRPANDRSRHGRFVAVVAEGGRAVEEDAADCPSSFDCLRPVCQPEGLAGGHWRVQLFGAVQAWEVDFAQAERARHGAFDDAEIAVGRVVVIACQLKVVDGGDWNRLRWLARVPSGATPGVGDVVQVRVGAREFSRDVGPIAEVLAPTSSAARPPGIGVVRCR